MNTILLLMFSMAQTAAPPNPFPPPPPFQGKEIDDTKSVDKQATAYHKALLQAVKENKHVIVFVRCQERKIPDNTIGVRYDNLVGTSGSVIVISSPDGEGWMKWDKEITSDANLDQIGAPLAVDPFRSHFQTQRQTVNC